MRHEPLVNSTEKIAVSGSALDLFRISDDGISRIRRLAMARMSEPVPGVGDRGPGQTQPQPTLGNKFFVVVRIVVFWYLAMQMFTREKPPRGDLLSDNLFSKGEHLDFWMFISETEKFSDFGNEKFLVWHELNVPYAVWTPGSVRHHQFTFLPSEAVQKNNASVYAHVYFSRSGYSPNPSDPDYDKLATFHATHSLVTYQPKSKVSSHKSLLAKDESDQQPLTAIEEIYESPTLEDKKWISLWKPNMTINLVDDFTRYSRSGAPATVVEYLNVDESSGNYYPTVYFNEFWLLRDKLILINETSRELLLDIELGPISFARWQLYLQVDQSFQIHRSYGSMIEGEADELKRVFLEGNPVLLAVTVAVSLLHTVFDFLAFKSDIQFWNKNKSMEGLSARSVVINFVCQVIVFLYLLDNETSWMILLSSGVGCCIEIWKIGKAMHIEIDWSGGFPWLTLRDRESYSRNMTKEYDDLAMKYLFYALYPIVACFAIYSLTNEKHKSWYSWILSSLTSCVYTFGFIMMCPQLFINYKLKSVAHLPWRQMTYKFLNTVIDDLFAFVIKMPWLHRLSVFRDDAIFLIYLYQRWVYPVDKERINEFGFGGEICGVQASHVQEGAGSLELGTTEESSSGIAVFPEHGIKRTGAGLRAAAKDKSAASDGQARSNMKNL